MYLKLILICLFSLTAFAKLKPAKQIKYRTFFGNCPSRSSGKLTLKLVELFENTGSLRSIKKKIVEDELDKRHFLSSYRVTYGPNKNILKFYYDCPEPLMKAQVYKDDGMESYSAVLGSNGTLLDPTYEVLLRSEGKLKNELPLLAIPLAKIDSGAQFEIAKIIISMTAKFKRNISEIILDENNELTIILSVRDNPISVFMGSDRWRNKSQKLLRIVEYMSKKKRYPAIVNLTNDKKIVVKFSDKF